MKTLFLLRHGKSDWSADVGDAARPLTKRGRDAARSTGRFLTRAGHMPDAVVTSPARRAVDTASLAAATGSWQCEIRQQVLLYGADAVAVLDIARAETTATQRLLLVGHEPALSETLALLVGGGAHRMPTAAVAAIEFDTEQWADLAPGRGRLLFLIPPRLLAEA
jgi:phosphohistidine phosphatase